MRKKNKSPLSEWLEWGILLLIIFAVLLDLSGILPGDIIYITAIVSISTICYIFYKISITKLFFGKKIKNLDLWIVFSFLFLSSKTLLGLFLGAVAEASFLFDFLSFLVIHDLTIEFYAFYIGSIAILLISIYIADKIKVSKNSIIGFLKERGRARTLWRVIIRAIVVFLAILSFYIIIFNLLLEWLMIAADNLLVLFAIVFYLFFLVKYAKRFKASHIVFKIGGFGETIYSNFIRLFTKKKTFLFGISGILVIHLLVDAAVFLYPYLTGASSVYMDILGKKGHTPVFTLFFQDIAGKSIIDIASVSWVYVFNIIAMMILLLSPFLVWYLIYSKRSARIPGSIITLFYIALTCYILAPIFKISAIRASGIVGVDIQTMSVLSSSVPLYFVLAASILVGLFVGTLTHFSWIKEKLLRLSLVVLGIFFGVYIILFISSMWPYFSGAIVELIASPHVFIAFYFFCFFAIYLLFYPVAFIIFVKEVKDKIKEFK